MGGQVVLENVVMNHATTNDSCQLFDSCPNDRTSITPSYGFGLLRADIRVRKWGLDGGSGDSEMRSDRGHHTSFFHPFASPPSTDSCERVRVSV